MKRNYLFLSIIFVILLAACGPSNAEPQPTEAPEAEVDVIPRQTITPTPVVDTAAAEEAYPARPTVTSIPAGYPQPEVLPTTDPYPVEGDTVWMIKAAGEQCAESLDYESEDEAVESLEVADIETQAVQTVDLVVISLCGSPTSTQYAVEINVEDLSAAEALGWTRVPTEEIPMFVMTPAGLQCEDPIYGSEAAARATLEAAGIPTYSSYTLELMVTSSCGSPTSTHYVVEIRLPDLEAAEALGWQVVPAGELTGN